MDLFAQAVDAAIGEDRAAQQRVLLGRVVADAELPGLDAFGPVRPDVRDVAVLLGRRPGTRTSSRTSASGRAAAAPGAIATPSALVVPVHATLFSSVTIETRGALDRRGVVEARDEHQRVLRAVLDREPEVGDLDDGGARPLARRRRSAIAGSAGPSSTAAHTRPCPPVERARRGRCRTTGCGRPAASASGCCGVGLGRAAEAVRLERQDRRHQLARARRARPTAARCVKLRA